MTTPSLGQKVAAQTVAAAFVDVVLPNVQAGSSIVVCTRTSANNRASSVTDDVNGSVYTKIQAFTTGPDETSMLYAVDVLPGTTTVTISYTSAISFRYSVYEILDAREFDSSDFVMNQVNHTDHRSSTLGLDTSAEVAIVMTGCHNAEGDTVTPEPEYTVDMYPFNSDFSAYKFSAGALSNQQGTWTSSTARQSTGIILALRDTGGAEPVLGATDLSVGTSLEQPDLQTQLAGLALNTRTQLSLAQVQTLLPGTDVDVGTLLSEPSLIVADVLQALDLNVGTLLNDPVLFVDVLQASDLNVGTGLTTPPLIIEGKPLVGELVMIQTEDRTILVQPDDRAIIVTNRRRVLQ